MLSQILFHAVWWGLSLLPISLLAFFSWKARNDQEEADGLQAWWIGLVCCTAPILHMLLAMLCSNQASQLNIYLNIFLSAVTLLTAAATICLLAGDAKVPECYGLGLLFRFDKEMI